MHYVGRFAPSPTGPLHFGSLVAALASYLDAKSHAGTWLLRIEDVDVPRCQPDSPQQIFDALSSHSLLWDGEAQYQSNHDARYSSWLNKIFEQQRAYYCQCTRRKIKDAGGTHNSNCRFEGATSGAIRLINDLPIRQFRDRFKGNVSITDPHALEDTVLKRKDGLYAYNMAVVADDICQGVNHIVRGEDLLDTTSAHLTLYNIFNVQPPVYAHIPIALDSHGKKLSKQNHASPISKHRASTNLIEASAFLGLSTSNMQPSDEPAIIVHCAIEQWRRKLDLLGE